jgi:hypothetical protein
MTNSDATISGGNIADAVDIEIEDVNGDGFGDFIYVTSGGAIYVVLGPFSESYIDLDQISPDIEIIGDFNISAGGVENKDISGSQSAVITGGDYNNDGTNDIAIGISAENKVWVFFGGSGLNGTLSTASAGVTITGADSGDMFGSSLASADVDADGVTDLIIGASGDDGADENAADCGAFYVLYGNTALASAYSATELFAMYNDEEGEEGGTNLFVADLDGDGRIEVIYTTALDKSVVVYLSQLAMASDELLVSLGDHTPAALEITTTEMSNIVMMQLKVTNVKEEDGIFSSLTVTGNGTGDEGADVSAVRIYQDVNGDGLLDSGDTQLGTDRTYAGDDGTITFSDFSVTIGSGASVNVLVVYDISLSMSYAGSGMTISAAHAGARAPAFAALLPLMMLMLVFCRRRFMRRLIFGIMLLVLFGLASCGGDDGGRGAGGEMTFTVGVTDNGHIQIMGATSNASISVTGAPLTGNTLTVK